MLIPHAALSCTNELLSRLISLLLQLRLLQLRSTKMWEKIERK